MHPIRIALTLHLLAAVSFAIEASTSQLTRPVLIRNEHNTLLRLTIQTDEPFVHLESIEVSIQGAEFLESMQFYLAGDKGEFSSEKGFGDRKSAAAETKFDGHARMKAGDNHFWLSCRVKPDADLTSRVDATVVRAVTSAGEATPKDTTPGVSKRIGIALRRHWDDGVHTSRIPVLVTSTKGTLLCAYDMRRRAGRDLQEDIDIGLVRSEDGGRTWNAQQVIMDMGEHNGKAQELNGVSDPGLIVDPKTGEIFCFAVWMQDKPGKHQWRGDGSEAGHEIGKSAQLLMVSSKDDGLTWSEPKNMTSEWKDPSWILYAPSPQQGIALADGTLVMPMQGRDAEDKRFSNLMISKDHGETWTVSQPASFGNNECQAALLSDGAIMLNCRTFEPKFRTVMITRDLGQTWEAHPTNRNTLIEPVCNGSLYRFSNVLLFANPHSQKGRTHHSIQVSFDDGMTWPAENRLLLDEGRGAGYPSLSRVADLHVGIVYEGSGSQVVFEKIAIQELVKPHTARTTSYESLIDIRSAIGKATIHRPGETWPPIKVRAHLKGLEGFSVKSGPDRLALSVLSHSDHRQLLHLWTDEKEGPQLTKESPFWTEAKRGETYFEIPVPAALVAENPESIVVEWIDFYR